MKFARRTESQKPAVHPGLLAFEGVFLQAETAPKAKLPEMHQERERKKHDLISRQVTNPNRIHDGALTPVPKA